MQPDILAIFLAAARYYLKFRAIALTLRARPHYLLLRPIGLALRPHPLMIGIAVKLHESPAAQPLFFVQDRRSYWRGPPVAGKLLVGVGKSDQRPFAPGPSQKLKAHRQIFSDETHRHNDNRPLCR